jgi:uncharacterized protein YbaP (TraB family)
MLLALALLLAPWMQAAGLEPDAYRIAPAVQQGLLWRIDRPGVAASHVFGTMHSEHPDIVNLPGTVHETLAASAAVTLEMVLDPQNLAQLGASMLITDGPQLPELIGADLYRRTVAVMAGYGVPEQALRLMQPWAVATTLMVPKPTTGLFLDRVLYLEALAGGKPVSGLETAEEQLAIFSGLGADDQVALLEEALQQLPMQDETYARMRAAYVRRDLHGLVEIGEAALRESDPELARYFNERVIVARNHRMVERMQPGLRRGNTFFAVGALHLPGEEGILELLRRQGYRVSAVY